MPNLSGRLDAIERAAALSTTPAVPWFAEPDPDDPGAVVFESNGAPVRMDADAFAALCADAGHRPLTWYDPPPPGPTLD